MADHRRRTAWTLVKTIRIHVPTAVGISGQVHDLQNVGEEIHCHFLGTGIVEIPDMDSATTSLHVRVSAPRHLGDVTRVIQKALKRYRLSKLAEVTRGCSARLGFNLGARPRCAVSRRVTKGTSPLATWARFRCTSLGRSGGPFERRRSRRRQPRLNSGTQARLNPPD